MTLTETRELISQLTKIEQLKLSALFLSNFGTGNDHLETDEKLGTRLDKNLLEGLDSLNVRELINIREQLSESLMANLETFSGSMKLAKELLISEMDSPYHELISNAVSEIKEALAISEYEM